MSWHILTASMFMFLLVCIFLLVWELGLIVGCLVVMVEILL